MNYFKKKARLIFTLLFFGVYQSGFSQIPQMWNPSYQIGTVNGIYNYPPGNISTQLVEIYPAAIPNTGLTYQWYSSSSPLTGFTPISGATSSSYTVPSPFSATTYYYRIATGNMLIPSRVSNIIKLSLSSNYWEDVNYIREHDVLIKGLQDWLSIDQLPIGSKLQTTTYMDGLGRPVEKVGKQLTTPPTGSNVWGDLVDFYQYDQYGRESTKYLPYSTTSQPGVFKNSPITDQTAYYSNTATYNETSAYSSFTYDKSPLNKVVNIKEPGANWAAGTGNSAAYGMNTSSDNVQIWGVDYVQGDAPTYRGSYATGTLYKLTSTDVNGNQVVEFTDMAGQIILKKVQAVATPTDPYTGWLCTYNVYDEFGLLRFQIQPEGVKWLYANSWNFAAANGATVLAEQVFQYGYDDAGRTIWKKAPGASPLNMVYDLRGRVVLMQDGNQAAMSTPQWTASCYDGLDRPVMSALLNTTEPLSAMQTDAVNAPASVSISVTATANTGGQTIPLTLSLCPGSINASSLNNSSSTVVLKYLFYDNYSFPGSKTFDNTFTNLSAYNPASDPSILPIAQSLRTLNLPTGNRVRVLGSASTYLSSTSIYDEKGHHIQALADNIKSGTDVTTLQYYFDGRMLSTSNTHTNSSANFTSFNTLNKFLFDKLGRVTSIQKTVGSNAAVTVASYDYDDFGRVKTKHLSPGYNNATTSLTELESLNYSFNIHGQMSGINRDYALKTPGVYNKWGHYFGMDIGFDKTDNVFSKAQMNGQVGGLAWNTMGDDAQRKYDYTYDNAGRLVNAAFGQQQHPGDGWGNSTMDFSVSGTSGQITYDNNGNLLTMLQKGVMPGQSTPLIVDDLRYTYKAYSNKLDYVTDQMTATSFNGAFGDFKDGANAAGTSDYVYDNNGNVLVDLNKNVQNLTGTTNGIHYNYLDKPDQIRLVGKGTILIVYNADGRKLQRTFIPESGGVSTITSYIDQYVYQETSTTLTVSSLPPFTGTSPHLAYINFEEGRIRAMTASSTNNGYDATSESGNLTLPAAPSGGYSSGAWDFYIMDYQRNVRMILTEEAHSALSDCTMETARAAVEDPVFGQTGTANEVETTRMNTPTAWTGNTSASVSHIGNLSGHTLGPNTLQKVMAGDRVSAQTDYYYTGIYTGTNPNIVNNLLVNMASLITNGGATAGGLAKSAAGNITSQLNATPAFVSAVQPNNNTTGTPQAYITMLFFDERFNFISSADGGVYQQQVRSTDAGNANPAPLVIPAALAPKNGYVYVYVSNRSDQDVYFDNVKVTVQTGNIIEENHYYAFGLKIAAISSRKLGDGNEGKLSNPYQYNRKEQLDEDGGLGWYDYGFRNYDPQIGRFPQLDPLTYEYPMLTPYQYASNDPITNIDVDGLEGCPSTAGMVGFGGVIRGTASVLSSVSNAILSASSAINIVSFVITATNTTLRIGQVQSTQDIINSSFTSMGAGKGGSGSAGSNNGPSTRGYDQPDDDDDDFPKLSPIFFEESLFPAIEAIDLEYFETMAPPEQKFDIGGPVVYLVFHYLGDKTQKVANRNRSKREYDGPPNPNSKFIQQHEVPYATTMEAKEGPNLRQNASKLQNEGHGVALGLFYQRNHLKRGDEFLVPLLRWKLSPAPVRKPVPVLVPIPKYKKAPDLKDLIKERKPPQTQPDFPPLLVPIILVEEYWWVVILL